jgi:PAS domain-containing protein
LLRASEERFRALIENSFDVMFILNADATAKDTSPSAASLLGRPEKTPWLESKLQLVRWGNGAR